ncbi:hypothetical protein Q73A0000_03835 [Kaistella flava (ex Peng et al. 2021)]|uniref:Aspartyl protease n=1 Tax=Kaistella flava (ex Peng et al. 2021) TaxID=2038776 RepID=A0A7M2Y7G5_9FLAO|nr:aspartyl protease family protein [Kaistella flava (ex Peng et al. 2021)]QOW09555.1 hypothetical protein Q73A0000_03835 [Kaistella flava (ex Peng et al. 2021)]
MKKLISQLIDCEQKRKTLVRIPKETTLKNIYIILSLILYSLIYSQEKIEIPFTYENNLINIQIGVNGKKEHFIFDTGARNVLTKKFADESHFKLKDGRKIGGYKGKTESFKTDVKLITIQNKDLNDVSFIVLDWEFLNQLNISGIVGVEFFTDLGYQKFMIDYKSKKIILGTELPVSPEYKFKMVKKGYPRILMKNEKFLIDTGNPLFGEISESILANNANCTKYTISSLSITNKHIDLCNIILPDEKNVNFNFQSFKIKNSRNVIGNLTLQNFIIYFDIENKEFYLNENKFFSTLKDIWFLNNNIGYIVSVINENSELYNLGIREGFYLTEINNKKVTEFLDGQEINFYLLNHKNMVLKFKNMDNIEITETVSEIK